MRSLLALPVDQFRQLAHRVERAERRLLLFTDRDMNVFELILASDLFEGPKCASRARVASGSAVGARKSLALCPPPAKCGQAPLWRHYPTTGATVDVEAARRDE